MLGREGGRDGWMLGMGWMPASSSIEDAWAYTQTDICQGSIIPTDNILHREGKENLSDICMYVDT